MITRDDRPLQRSMGARAANKGPRASGARFTSRLCRAVRQLARCLALPCMLSGLAQNLQQSRGCTFDAATISPFRSLLLPQRSLGHRRRNSAAFHVLAAAFRPCIDIHQVESTCSIFSMPIRSVQMCCLIAMWRALYSEELTDKVKVMLQWICHVAGQGQADRWVHLERSKHPQVR